MSVHSEQLHVFINQTRHEFPQHELPGRLIKEHALIPLDHVLCLEVGRKHPHLECGCEHKHEGAELEVIDNDQSVTLENGQHFWSHPIASHHRGVHIAINGQEYFFADPHQSGQSIKERAGIPTTDVLFLDRPQEDEVIANDAKITLKHGDCLHSEPPADYGNAVMTAESVGFGRFDTLPQPDGWIFLLIREFPLNDAFTPSTSRLLVKLPPAFPDAAPDMFWLNPHVRTAVGTAPQGTSTEQLLGEAWQRFSWHLRPGAWNPGSSTLRDFMRCVRARFERRN